MFSYAPLIGSARSRELEQQPKPLSPQEKQQNALKKRDFWRKVAADPKRPPEGAAAAASLARSWGAAALAYQKALQPEPAGEADESIFAGAVNLHLPADLARALQAPNMKRSPKSETLQSNGAALSPEAERISKEVKQLLKSKSDPQRREPLKAQEKRFEELSVFREDTNSSSEGPSQPPQGSDGTALGGDIGGIRPNLASKEGGETERPGYVYVLSTAYADKAGLPIVKIGRTSRTPDQRNQELSPGGDQPPETGPGRMLVHGWPLG